MGIWNDPCRGPFHGLKDAGLHLGPCELCGESENHPGEISRLRCEKCNRVICWKCADCGVYGSLSDFQFFVFRRGTRPEDYYLNQENCPNCQEMPWWQKYAGPPRPAGNESQQLVDVSEPPLSWTKGSRHTQPSQELEDEMLAVLRGMLDGSLGLIDGSRRVWRLWYAMNSPKIDQYDVLVFEQLDSLTDHLPVGEERMWWDERALNKWDLEIARVEEQNRVKVLKACKILLEKLVLR